jgi:hypothetical protein
VPPALSEPEIFLDQPFHVDLTKVAATPFDLANARFRSAVGYVAAPIHGKPRAELDSDDVREHRRLRRLRRLAISGLAVLLALALIFLVVAAREARRANREADAARRQAAVAEAQLAANRAATARTPWASLAFAVDAELRTPTPLPEARGAMTGALQRLGRLPVRPSGVIDNQPDYDPRVEWTTAGFNAFAWAPDSAVLATGAQDGTLQLWDATTLRAVGSGTTVLETITKIAWSPKRRQLVVAGTTRGGLDEAVRVVDPRGGQPRVVRGDFSVIDDLAWSPDGTLLAISDELGVRLVDPMTGRLLKRQPLTTLGRVDAVGWSPDGRKMVVAVDDSIDVYNIVSGRPDQRIANGPGVKPVNSLAWSPDGRSIAVGNLERTVRIWQVSTGRWLPRTESR